ncbi:hypothetical protein RHIZ404_180046 [Rhizobium sp. EC-SD404]|nr:hypothetical protein RHIZ404_180046 [Rhizobium sp. EC-SD404]
MRIGEGQYSLQKLLPAPPPAFSSVGAISSFDVDPDRWLHLVPLRKRCPLICGHPTRN